MPVTSPVRRPVSYPASRMGAAIAMGLIPEPAMAWDFARGESMGALAVTRSGATATYVDASGARRTVGANVARYDHDPRTGKVLGLLREPARTNLCLYSDDLSNANWYKDNTVIDGAMGIVENGANTAHGVTQAIARSGSTLYTDSAEIKAAGRRYAQLVADPGDATNYRWATFDLEDGIVTDDSGAGVVAAIRPGAAGHWLCSIAYTTPSSPTNPYLAILASDVATGFYPSYAGSSDLAIEVRGVQAEAGHCPTSRIATTSGSATRNADAVALAGADFAGMWRADEGALFVEAVMQDVPPSGATVFLVAANDGTTSERINLYVNEANAGMGLFVADGGVQQTLLTIAATANHVGDPMRMAAAWRVNSVRSAAAGGQLSTLDTSATMPTVDRMEIGTQASAGAASMATPIWVRRVSYWRERLPDEQLRLLSAA